MRLTLALCLFLPTAVLAGPEDPSTFDPVQYGPQKVLYDWNYATPEDGLRALGFIRNHIAAMEEFGDLEGSDIVVVAHGNDLHAFARQNAAAFPDAYTALQELADKGVKFHVCRNAAKGRGYEPDDFYDLITVVPAAVIDIAKYGNEGYSYMYPALFPRMTTQDIAEKYPEIGMAQD
ncbi:DsrE family protein [Paracoccus sp. TK19116]|uniref:DsrE family protein n=1 Tax=Paracoccus albicereus TaxID=2922394 RepID=A0ABT1MNG1_9RHOB|nr:DsrE family protein [Paracoccus albicereus]MCQ0969825.1 DsrE family protein [Paracoccus albicereus]